ncbi:helix-turn-helix transcriptional regulator [Brevibacterium jeotgali]|uniref:Putative transcriptional regulator n=1 Tax=Brevibacterium jeotgali TaxID=1262550 RepID=A0A2H1L2Z0_9MICO|nr:helix-turn-helix transcriptional regulator [Brevibacterium jeotgali]TWC02397.1 putative transcriptional regulator [Brevibacterium jeotgali]SMY11189.1 putative transcriptional regulator [Brevibacterium jeotgali]
MPNTAPPGSVTHDTSGPPERSASPIRALRRAAGLTQGELGKHVGVTRQTIAAMEKGDYAPSVYLALRISRCLGSTVEALFPLDKEPL